MRFIRFSLYSFLLLLVFSCQKSTEECQLDPKILDQDLNLQFTRLEDEFFNAKSAEDFEFLIEKYPDFAEDYLGRSLYSSPDTLISELIAIHQDSAMNVLYDSVKVHFQDLSEVEKDLENAFKYIKYYFPEFKVPKVYTFLSGFNSDLILSEDLIVIGLDYFLPPSHEFQPDLPRYMAERYDSPYIVPMIVTAISSKFNKTNPADNTMLAEMIYYGKAYHFTKAILPCTSEKYIIGYTEDEIAECYANEEYIWSHFVENELLYETNPFDITKYMGEAPFTDAISTKAPGRLGRWLGWNIVDDYQFNQDVSLVELMDNPDAEQIFRQSGYRPRNPNE
ncbi:gliding motility lipoprotein GldB [Algoriphagus machipongonensis]|nr:gliding motility lipoprotein GldB [Algoriphagus machipongonensis]